MADTPKRRKLEKVSEPTTLSNQKWYCSRCGTAFSRQKGYFPVSHSPMYRSSGYLPWCNDCVEEMYDYYREKLGSDKAAMRRMCMKLDLYWDEAIYEMVERTAGVQSRIRSYIGKTNINRYIDKTFDDTIIREDAEAANSPQVCDTNNAPEPVCEPPEEDNVPEEIRLFWGSGYTAQMYEDLEERRLYWEKKFPEGYVFDFGEEALLKQICGLEVDISRDRAAGRPVKDSVNTLNTLLGSANWKPAQKKEGVDAELEKMPLGVGLQKWENFRPLPETPKEMQDVSGTVKNVTTWLLGHLCKMVGLRNSYCKLYEDEMARLRVGRPEYDEEDDDTLLSDLFGHSGGDDG